jgi:hypothetical protein
VTLVERLRVEADAQELELGAAGLLREAADRIEELTPVATPTGRMVLNDGTWPHRYGKGCKDFACKPEAL